MEEDFLRLKQKNVIKLEDFTPKTILDVIKEEYPERYKKMFKKNPNKDELFTSKEWLNILTKSRNSYENYLKLRKKG